MAKPARRGSTPTYKNRKNHSDCAHGPTSTQCNRSCRDGGAKMETSNVHVKDVYASDACSAHHQHVDSDHRGSGKHAHSEAGEGIRLQKVLAQVGAASCRMTEKLIDEGRVEVDGKVMTRQGVWVDPNASVTRADGSRVIVNKDIQYFILSKPRGVQSTMHDDMGRPCVGDAIGEKISASQRLLHAGHLDAATEDLLLFTNDGELANRLMHPSYETTRTYMAIVVGEVDSKVTCELERGIESDDGIAKADMAQAIGVRQDRFIIHIELYEGRKHIVRRMFKAAGFLVEYPVHTKIHTVQLGEQVPRTLRALNRAELTSLYNAVGL